MFQFFFCECVVWDSISLSCEVVKKLKTWISTTSSSVDDHDLYSSWILQLLLLAICVSPPNFTPIYCVRFIITLARMRISAISLIAHLPQKQKLILFIVAIFICVVIVDWQLWSLKDELNCIHCPRETHCATQKCRQSHFFFVFIVIEN